MLANKSELEAAQGDLARGRVAISDSRLKLPELANALAFYMEIREYVRDVICCLNEKMPKIEYMDRKSIILYRERADTLMSRRRADVGDMADEAAGVVENGDNPEAAKSAEARRRRKADREARRTRRRHQSKPDEVQSKRLEATIGVVPSYEGVSSDDEEPQAVIARRAADFADIKNDAEHIFDDVVEEFCAIACILRRFAEWRERLARTYAQAYIPMCLPQLLAPLIRLQVLTWNPLEANCPSFDEYPWFGCLLDHYAGLRQTGGGAHEHAPAGDEAQKVLHSLGTSPDHELSVIPLAIERVLLPRLTEIVSASWDPMSWSQTQRLVTLLRTFAALWPTVSVDNKATQRLFEAALQRMEQTIQMDVFIPLYSKIVMSDPQSPGRLFFNRQLNVAMKLLSNLLQWHDLLAPAALKHLAFTCLVNRYILIGFASLMSTSVGEGPSELELWQEVASRLRAIVGQLPADWLTDPGDDKLAQLRRFVNQLIEKVAPEDTAVPTVETKEEMTMKPVLKKLKRIQNRLLAKPP
uniref:GCFC domain-containing protein n=1 Tax=Mesocestoides corti TaxID=53468 RepID=A0A5K3F6Z1_MESCO